MAGYEAWLRTLGESGIAALLRRRPEVLTEGRRPRSIHALATLLLRPHTVRAALLPENAATVDVAAAALLAGPSFRREALAHLLDEPDGVAPAVVDEALHRLQDLALVWSDEPNLWHVGGGLRGVLEAPFGLGPPLHRLLAQVPDKNLREMAPGMGIDRSAPPAQLRTLIESWLSEPEHVRVAAAGGPSAAAEVLSTLVWHDSLAGLLSPAADDPLDAGDGWQELSVLPVPGADEALAWLRRSGLLLRAGWEEHMPREVALALRGPGWRPQISTRPPVVEVDVGDVGVRRDAAAAAAALLHDAGRLVASLGDQPVALLRSADGGVGVREVKRLARVLGTEPRRVEMLLTLLHAVHLLDVGSERVTPAARARQWREQDPARQLADLLTAWWTWDGGVTQRPDRRSGKQSPVLSWLSLLGDQRHVRHAMLSALATLPEGRGTTGPEGVRETLLWERPLAASPSPELEDVLAAAWWEAGALGALGAGAASPLGRALAAGGGPATRDGAARLLEEATASLPPVTRTAVIQGDLTALVHGVASAALTDLLNGCADVEGTGGATRWRFTEMSIRRALDAGTAAEDLLTRLGDVAGRELPQPLVYLVRDVGRRHGSVRVASLRCAVVAADEALLTEVLHARALRSLGLRRLVDGVLASASPADETTEALRRAGFMPVLEDDAGRVVLEGAGRRAPGSGDERAPLDDDGRAWAPRALAAVDGADEDLHDAADATAVAVLRG